MIPLLVIRHAPTSWNEEGRIQGRTDIPLSEAGRRLANSWRLPQGWDGADCVASPLSRALETARLLGLHPRPEPALIEMSWAQWEGEQLSRLRKQHGATMVANEAQGLDFRPSDGESPRDVQARLLPWLQGLRSPTIAVSHKGVIRALYALATGWTMEGKAEHKLLPYAAHCFRVRDGRVEIGELNLSLEAG